MARPFPMILIGAALAGCVQASSSGAPVKSELIRQTQTAPAGTPAGSCWGKIVTPAHVETITEQVMVQPPEISADGTVISPAIYKTETRAAITRERHETWFETLCQVDLTPDLIASVQRALKVRGKYRGATNGRMYTRTRAAIRQFQKANGLDTDVLTMETAQTLGLAPVRNTDAQE